MYITTCISMLLLGLGASMGHIFPNIRVMKHDRQNAQAYLRSMAKEPFNHEYVGSSKSSDSRPCSSFIDLRRSTQVGVGRADFERASKLMFSFAMINDLKWAEVIFPSNVAVGDTIGTLVKCYKLVWSLNPCRITSVRREKRVSEVAFSTLSGHLIAGEERFRVTYDENDQSVIFSMYSFTKGATIGPGILGMAGGIVGKVAMPFIRPLQRSFFASQESAMMSLMRTGSI